MLPSLIKGVQRVFFSQPQQASNKILKNMTPISNILQLQRSKTTGKVPDSELHPVARSAQAQPGTGKIYDKKPFKFEAVKGKSYYWCNCGWSHNQPFCDGTHKSPHMKITLRPVRFIAPETKDYWFCNCKQTKSRPLCDGSHKHPDVQSAIKS